MVFCFVPGCNSGYPSQRKVFKKLGIKNPSLFSCSLQDDLEIWNRAIPRADRTLTAKDKVCELHFDSNDIERYFNHRFPDGSIQALERGKPLLKPGAIPTIFPNLPDYFLQKAKRRKAPVEYAPTAKKIKVCELNLESNFEREASIYDLNTNKRHTYDSKNVKLKKDSTQGLFQNTRNYLSRRRTRQEDSEKRLIGLENEQLQNTVQQSLESSSEKKKPAVEDTVTPLLVPIDTLKKTDLTTSRSFHWNKTEVTALIALYQSEKCLYDKKHKHYHNLYEKDKARKRIKSVLAKMNFICTIQQIKTKISSLCSTYASEKAYKDKCIQAGQFTEDTYAPIMWCFGLLQFLDDFIEPRTEVKSVDKVIQIEPEEASNMEKNVPLKINQSFSLNTDFNVNFKIEPEVSYVEENVPLKINSSFSLNTGFNKNFKDVKEIGVCNKSEVDSDVVINEVNKRGIRAKIKISASNKLNPIKIFSQDSEEKEDIFGEYIASEMKTLKDDPLLYMETKQAIANVLTNAHFDLLITK